MSTLVKRAKALAEQAHANQRDKAGNPYIEHVARVAAAVADDPEAEAVAWMHDIREDTPALADKVEYICRKETGGDDLFKACCLLDRGTCDSSALYYQRIRANPLALRVKLADIADNANEARLASLDQATAERLRQKYATALEQLLN